MSIDLKTIKHISKLSRISVDEANAKKLQGDLNSIFEFIEKLNQLKTENIEPFINSYKSILIKNSGIIDSHELMNNLFRISNKYHTYIMRIL